jgi:hypothetical protein
MISHIIDNLEIEINTVHLRIESPEYKNSMGITLKHLSILTTDQAWKPAIQ